MANPPDHSTAELVVVVVIVVVVVVIVVVVVVGMWGIKIHGLPPLN